MKLIDRLLIEAKTMLGDRQLICAMVDRDGPLWVARAHFIDKTKEHGTIIESSTHASLDDAIDHLHKLGEKHPNSRDVPIIIDDLPLG